MLSLSTVTHVPLPQPTVGMTRAKEGLEFEIPRHTCPLTANLSATPVQRLYHYPLRPTSNTTGDIVRYAGLMPFTHTLTC